MATTSRRWAGCGIVRITLGTLLLLLLLARATASAQPYTAVDLGVLPGQTMSVATDINNRFQVVGYSGDQAFVWEPGTGLRALGVRTGGRLLINNHGIIAGVRIIEDRLQPFAWLDGVVYDLPTPVGHTLWAVGGLTDSGILLMHGTTALPDRRASTWAYYDGALYDLAALTGASIAAVNEQGVLGGTAESQPYLRYPDGRVVMPWTPMWGSGSVLVIGPAGHFAGLTLFDAYYYGTPDGAVQRMFSATPRTGATLADINRAGDLVGTYRFVPFPDSTTAFLYRNGQLTILDSAVVSGSIVVAEAHAINDAGHIAGVGRIDGAPRAVVLVPTVPDPPAGLSHTVTGSVVSLSWQAAVGAIDYILEAGSVPGAGDLLNAPVGAHPSLMTPAPPGRYYVRVRARNATGVSEPSEEVVVEVP
jgi:hypothetical protein